LNAYTESSSRYMAEVECLGDDVARALKPRCAFAVEARRVVAQDTVVGVLAHAAVRREVVVAAVAVVARDDQPAWLGWRIRHREREHRFAAV
jgi:hypothetical protein